MRNVNKKKKIITCSVLLFSFLSITLFSNLNFEAPFYKDDVNKDDFINVPKTSDSLPSSNGVGDDVNISLHQSYLNTSTIEFTNLDNINSFTEPFPNFNGYDTSFVNMTIDGIFAPNYSLIVEDDFQVFQGYQIASALLPYASFTVKSSCYLDNISTVLYNDNDAINADIQIRIYNSTWNSGQSRNEPDSGYTQIVSYGTYTFNNFDGWYNFTNLNHFLNISKTANHTFYVYIRDGNDDNTQWRWASDGALPDNIDEQNAYEYNPSLQFINPSGSTIDLTLKVDIIPLSNTPRPEHIGLNINNSAVTGYDNINGSGYWNPNQSFSSATDELNFIVSADWWDVSCNITQVQINYTKTDLQADSSFEVLGNGQDVLWNVTKSGGLNYFDSQFNNYTINFTISSRWTNVEVWNGGTNKTGDIIPYDLNNYKNIQVFNADNGTYWFLNATSSNLLTNIKKYTDITPEDSFNYTDLVHFNGNFSSAINNGTITLNVYNPLVLDDQLNYTFVNSSFGSGTDIYFGDWDISDNVTKYGIFRILTQWNNGTDAGFFRDNITILAETSIVLNQPIQFSTFNSSEIFNITLTYNDTGQSRDISDGDIYYKINTGAYSSVNESVAYIDNGRYNVTFDCNNTEFNYGLNTITVRANNTYYNNQTETLDFIILGETEIKILNPIDNTLFNSSESFNITVLYNDTIKNLGIDGATIEYRLDPTASFKSDNIVPIGNGYYNITIDCNDTDFNGYDPKTIIINVSKYLYYNQSSLLDVRLLGETSLTILNPSDLTVFNSGDTFNVTILYNDTVKNEGIDGATIEYQLEPSASYKSSNIVPLGNGYYNISISCNDTDFDDYGQKNIKINVSKQYYYNQTKTVQITIHGETELTILSPPILTVFNSGNIFNMTVFYNDTVLDLGIEADVISYQIGAGSIRTTENITYLGNGYYNITFSCNDTDFNYGLNIIVVNTTKHYYNNQSESRSITILGETEATILYPPNNAEFDSGDTFKLTIFYNDTIKNIGIAGATLNYSIDGGISYRYDNINYIGSGEYNITISASDAQFGGYGFKDIIVNCSKDYYHNQSNTISIKILGETSISAQRIPDKSYYTAAETFNISVYFRDTVESLGISGADIDIDVDGTLYNPEIFDNGDGYYNITIDCSHLIFSIYKLFSIRINVSLVNYHNQSIILDTLIVGNETLYVLAPTSGAIFIEGQTFDITIEYNDSIRDVGIDGATIEYSLNEGSTYRQDNIIYIGDGKYNITINVNDLDFPKYGFVEIYIDAYKQFYENRSTTYTFHRQITTEIKPLNIIDLGSIMKGLNISYTFNYSDTNGKSIQEVSWSRLSSPVGFTAFLENRGNGNYTMHLDTTNVLVTGSTDVYEFNVYATGNETQIIRLTIDILVIQTEVINVSRISEIARNSRLNQSVRFYFNDTTNNLPVLNVITANIVVINYATGTPFSDGEFWLFDPFSNGTYILDITMGIRNSGWYTLEINASKFPNYDYSLFNVTFYYRGNYTQLNLISYSDPGGILAPIGLGYNFTIFEGSDTTITLNLTDIEYGNSTILGVANSYTSSYLNLVTSSNGALSSLFVFTSPNHIGTLTTSLSALIPGRYLINITLSNTNYEEASLSFNLTVIAKYQANLTVLYKPIEVNAGELFRIIVQAEIFNGITWIPLQNTAITMTPIFDGVPSSGVQIKTTNSTGQLFFEITIRSDATTMNISLELSVQYDHLGDTMVIFDIGVIPPPPGGFSFEDLLPFIIIIVAAIVAVGGSLAVYRGVIVPKKREKQRILTEVKTIFDDAINLEHILVLYKGTGTCVFFKSFGSEQIDPELIGGFLSAVSSFGKEMSTQETLNEISYGDKMLLLADGGLIRVALVLGKNASLILRRHLKEFIGAFEKAYNDILPNWRGQLNPFRNAGTIVDEFLNTSIILPHKISYEISNAKELKNPHSKEVLKVAQSCCEEAEREFFFIATLLKEVADRTNKGTAEIFMGIKELRDKKILIPIEISAIGAQPVSQQEINLINQKVMTLTNLTNEEKQKLVNDLAQLGPIEREAYFSSLAEQQEIISAPIKTTIGDLSVENPKAAKKGIKELLKRAKIAQSKKKYIKAVEIYESAALLASNWELSTELLKIQETTRKVRIEDLSTKKSNLENEAKVAVKENKYLEAATKYKYASKMASEIFKLGVTEMTKEVKRLTNKANEYEKMK